MQDHFYKYTDIDTAKAILTNQSFRYSSPLIFNDPFDVQNELLPNFNLNEFPVVIMSVIEDYVKNDYPIPNSKEGFGKAIYMLREGAKSQGYKKDKIEEIIYPLLGVLEDELKHGIEQMNLSWNKSMRESRVFCVTEDNDNLLMWAHYAKDHTGAVFQLATLAKDDNMLSAARKVKYEKEPIAFFSMEELVKWTLFNVVPDFSRILYTSHAHQKSEHWSYEKEWRVVDMCSYDNKNEFYVDHKFVSKQLQNIFFGCKTDPTDIEYLSRIARAINPTIGIYQAKKRSLEYAIDFDKI